MFVPKSVPIYRNPDFLTLQLTVFQLFFVTVQLPYSIVRGEIFILQANVFSYYPEDLEVG
ncbi:MAG: alpha-2-macroglobulin family protein [Candidatus Thiodiazotropha sp.]